MSSDAQKAASRANGAKSQGPVTAPGKLNVARNAIRHGILAHTIVLEGEDSALFETLIRDFTAEFQPRGPVQTALVENLAVSRWRQMRIWGLEKEGLNHEIRNQVQEPHHPAARAAQAFRALCDQSRSLDLMNRYETHYDRQFARALSRLLKIAKQTQEVVDS